MRYTFIKQHDATDCAAACMGMVCLHYKKETTITKLRDMMGTDLKGTNLIGLSKCAEELGFNCQAVKVDKEGFVSRYTLPAIANIVTKEGLSHFVVIFRITKKYVIIGDPAKDLERLTIDEFYKKFTGAMLLLKPNSEFEREKIKGTKLFDRYIKLLLPQKKLFIYALVASLLVTLLGILSSLFNNIIYDEILPYQQKDVLKMMLAVFLGISLTSTFVSFVRQWILMHLSIKIDIPLMLGYFEHIYKLPMKFFASRKTGDITTRFSDAFTIKDIFTSIALSLIMDISMALITGVILFQMNPKLFAVIVMMTLISIVLVFIFKQPYKKINEEQMQQSSILNSEIIEGLRAVETIKGNANEDIELESIEREYIKSLRISYKEGMLSNVQSTISSVISGVGNLVLLYVGIMQVINNNMTLGSFMAFNTLAGYFMDPIGNLVSLQLSIQEANISMKRLSEIMDYEREQKSERQYQEISSIDGDIKLDHVTFRYGNRKPALDDVSFIIEKGQKVALVGASGSGKSTIAKLLLKYYEPEAGNITIDGMEISEYKNDDIRHAISYVPQNIELFSKSIYDNIAYGPRIFGIKKKSELDEIVERSLRQAAIWDEVKDRLHKSALGMSGGQQQRLCIARALAMQPEVLLMDEPTSALDPISTSKIEELTLELKKDYTIVIVTHNMQQAMRISDKTAFFLLGDLIEYSDTETLFSTPKEKKTEDYITGRFG
mgnify:CR=1 FL=1